MKLHIPLGSSYEIVGHRIGEPVRRPDEPHPGQPVQRSYLPLKIRLNSTSGTIPPLNESSTGSEKQPPEKTATVGLWSRIASRAPRANAAKTAAKAANLDTLPFEIKKMIVLQNHQSDASKARELARLQGLSQSFKAVADEILTSNNPARKGIQNQTADQRSAYRRQQFHKALCRLENDQTIKANEFHTELTTLLRNAKDVCIKVACLSDRERKQIILNTLAQKRDLQTLELVAVRDGYAVGKILEIAPGIADSNPDLRHFSLVFVNCDINDRDARSLGTNKKLTALNLYSNNVGRAGVQALAASKSLTSLNLCSNRIGDVEARALAANDRLVSLNLSKNWVGADGALALAANTSLRSLDISFNRIEDHGARALELNRTLTSLNIEGNNREVPIILAFAMADD